MSGTPTYQTIADIQADEHVPSFAELLGHLPLAVVLRVIAPWAAKVLERSLDPASLAYEREQLQRDFAESAAIYLTDAERLKLVDELGYLLNEQSAAASLAEEDALLKQFGLTPEAMEANQQAALDLIRADGLDPDEVLRRAGENLTAWRANPSTDTSWPKDEPIPPMDIQVGVKGMTVEEIAAKYGDVKRKCSDCGGKWIAGQCVDVKCTLGQYDNNGQDLELERRELVAEVERLKRHLAEATATERERCAALLESFAQVKPTLQVHGSYREVRDLTLQVAADHIRAAPEPAVEPIVDAMLLTTHAPRSA